MADVKTDKAETAPTDLLSKFLGDLAQLPKIMVDGMLKQADNEDEKEVIRALGGTLNSQFSELTVYIRERAGKLSVQQKQESEQVLRLSSAGSLIANGSSLAANLTSQVAKDRPGGHRHGDQEDHSDAARGIRNQDSQVA